MTKIDPKMLKIKQIDQKISEKCISFCKIPTQDKNQGISPNPTACPQTYWEAPSQLPTQFPPLAQANPKSVPVCLSPIPRHLISRATRDIIEKLVEINVKDGL